MVRNTLLLPTGYYELIKVDLQKDKKLALFINVGSLLILAAMVVPTAIICPPLDFTSIMENPNGFQNDLFTFLLRWLPLLGGMIVYFVLHELTHGICMKAFTKTKVKYGYTGLYFLQGARRISTKILHYNSASPSSFARSSLTCFEFAVRRFMVLDNISYSGYEYFGFNRRSICNSKIPPSASRYLDSGYRRFNDGVF